MGRLYSPTLSSQIKTAFIKQYTTNLVQMRFNNYYVSTVRPTILGEVIEMETEEYIDIINEAWNLIPYTLVLYSEYLAFYIRPKYLDLLNNPYLTN